MKGTDTMSDRPTTLVYNDLVSEGFHAAFRKASDHQLAHEIWTRICDLPAEEWNNVIAFVLEGSRADDHP